MTNPEKLLEEKIEIEIPDSILKLKQELESSSKRDTKQLVAIFNIAKQLECAPLELTSLEYNELPKEQKELYFSIRLRSKVKGSNALYIKYVVFVPMTKNNNETDENNQKDLSVADISQQEA